MQEPTHPPFPPTNPSLSPVTFGNGQVPPTPDPDLPPELQPVHQRHGALWEIGYEPLCDGAPYLAHPRFGGGNDIRTDTARLLDRVLSKVTPPYAGEEPSAPDDSDPYSAPDSDSSSDD